MNEFDLQSPNELGTGKRDSLSKVTLIYMNKIPENNSDYIYSNKVLAPYERSQHKYKKSLGNNNKVEFT